ncbi:olfactory receptor 14I1-like [Hemicordylus capensis]|uniref:olfactory receptor 14I1-like n=1 Tax=Hemicordylus capensis TaxID=884348 RepID=UPI0023033E48|nr:olfactory receptor 14I1-like [Hemicordylus capensis]
MINQTRREFILLGFSEVRELQILHFVLFLCIYLAALMGNFLIVVTVTQNQNLHSPMYFFLCNVSILDACFISITVPKSLANLLMHERRISFSGCIMQVFLIVKFASAELYLLTIMAYDRYIAICHPLQYAVIMNWDACFQMAAAAWITSLISGLVNTANTFRLHFCRSNVIKLFFCDIPQLLMLSCTDTKANTWLITIISVTAGSFCFSFVMVSYGYIFATVFKIQSAQARHKAFSTCMPHLIVFCLFLSTAMFSYMRPKALSSPPVDLLAAVLYTVLPPLMNPIIYCLRNKEIRKTVWKMAKKRFGFRMALPLSFAK